VQDLLLLLGKRVHELRTAKKWSQEEFAHVSGLHRTYIGQIERGEKNISFANLSKIAAVLGVTMSELLAGLESGDRSEEASKRGTPRKTDPGHRLFEIQKLTRRLLTQRTAMDSTLRMLEELATDDVSTRRTRERAPKS
jgi:transcriptional regulator with XRE-family HTH domain